MVYRSNCLTFAPRSNQHFCVYLSTNMPNYTSKKVQHFAYLERQSCFFFLIKYNVWECSMWVSHLFMVFFSLNCTVPLIHSPVYQVSYGKVKAVFFSSASPPAVAPFRTDDLCPSPSQATCGVWWKGQGAELDNRVWCLVDVLLVCSWCFPGQSVIAGLLAFSGL